MYKAIGFDMGGVLIFYSIPNQLGLISEQLGVPLEKVKAVYAVIRPRLDVDAINNRLFWEELVKQTRSKVDPETTEHIWSDNYINGNPLIAGMLDLVDKLRMQGYKVGLLSNIDREHGEINAGRGILEHFDLALLSYRIKVRKPESAAYEQLWRGLGVEPTELVFVDDLEANVQAAERLGIAGLKFEDRAKLELDLKSLGISV